MKKIYIFNALGIISLITLISMNTVGAADLSGLMGDIAENRAASVVMIMPEIEELFEEASLNAVGTDVMVAGHSPILVDDSIAEVASDVMSEFDDYHISERLFDIDELRVLLDI